MMVEGGSGIREEGGWEREEGGREGSKYPEGGVAGSFLVGVVYKHQLVAGVGEPCTQELLRETKHLNRW